MLHDALKIVVDTCHAHLLEYDQETLSYIKNDRHLTDKTIIDWKLGSFPTNPKILYELNKKIQPYKEEFDEIFYHIIRFYGTYFESSFFNNRFIIPITNQYGEYSGIVGRTTLSEAEQKQNKVVKYFNTPYAKTHELFGLHNCIETAIKVNELIIVEGNLDVITAHQHNIKNICGCSSTNVSVHHLALAARYVDNVSILMDSDEAGEKAKEKLKKELPAAAKELGLNLSFIDITKGKDVDAFLQQERKW